MVLLTRESNKYCSVYYFLGCLILVAFPFSLRAQEVNTKTDNELQHILGSLEEADEVKLERIYDLDMFDYFNLGDDYNTKLKMKVFKKTPEYAEKLDEFKKVKKEMLKEMFKTDYYLKLDEEFVNNSYDVERNGFTVFISTNWQDEPGKKFGAPKSVRRWGWLGRITKGFLLSSLPTKTKGFNPFPLGPECYQEELFFPMSEEKGLEIENSNPNDIKIYFIFRISGQETVRYRVCDPEKYVHPNREDRLFKVDKVRVLIANDETGKIYFDKVYAKASR